MKDCAGREGLYPVRLQGTELPCPVLFLLRFNINGPVNSEVMLNRTASRQAIPGGSSPVFAGFFCVLRGRNSAPFPIEFR